MRFRLGWIGAAVGAVILAGLTALGLWALSFADRHTRVLLPDDLALTPPVAGLAPNIAGFAGLWGGDRWDGGPLPVALAVERIGADRTASIVYAWGANLEAHRTQGWRRLSVKITTARTQLASIFAKTAIRRQAKLVAILARIAHIEQSAGALPAEIF